MKTTEKTGQATSPKQIEVEFTNAYYLKGLKLEQVNTDEEGAKKILETDVKEKRFRTGGELGGIILNNDKALFGEQTYLLDCAEKRSIIFPGDFIPHGLLIDVREKENPRLFFIEAMLPKENMTTLFSRITNIFFFFSKQEHTQQFLTILDNSIRINIGWRNKLKAVFEDKPSFEFLHKMLKRKPGILLVTDSLKPEITPFMETYTETWGKLIKPILIRKFEAGEDTLVTMVPTFAELTTKGKIKDKPAKKTEEDHLEGISDSIKEIYLHLKSELLKTDTTLEFRVKGHYISMRKDRNIAFFQFGKNKLSIVIANPEKGMREQIKHHAVRTLAQSVKKFWNGNENCFTVVLESKEHLDEVLNLLKKVADVKKINGNAPASQMKGDDKKKVKAPPKVKVKANQGKSDKKLQAKKK